MKTLEVLERFNKTVQENESIVVKPSDRALSALFQSKAVLEPLNHYLETQQDHFETDTTGHDFHKSFREWSVIEDMMLAAAVWTLIGESRLFWEVVEELRTNMQRKRIFTSTDDLNNHNYS
ncbi:hypothetical protein [Vibrio crassostreae]|uniref:hypothetical protein n=1 Tax=Vibrio crassostreae TaxID=246167 RepID=UPI001B30C4F9|nr:hypothetical protein [Vibrio crassostreae]